MRNEEFHADFDKAAGHWLELFDSELASDGVPIAARPFKSAILFVDHGIQEIRGGSKDDYFEQDWFAGVVVSTRRWYADRYGAAALEHEKDSLWGIAVHFTQSRHGRRY